MTISTSQPRIVLGTTTHTKVLTVDQSTYRPTFAADNTPNPQQARS
jgi:hypothetical protein